MEIPFIETVAEESRPAVTKFVENSGATPEDISGFNSFDEFLSGYKPKTPQAQGDWTTSLEAGQKELVGVKGWKTPADTIKGYSELEKLVGHEKIAMPRKDKNGNYEAGEFERVMTQLGMPKDAKEYKESANYKLPEGLVLDDKFYSAFKAEAHKAGLLPSQYAFVMDQLAIVLNQGTAAQREANEKAYNEAVFNLRNKWGLAYETKSKIANDILRSFAADPKQGAEITKKYANDPLIIELLANVGDNLSEDSLIRKNMSGAILAPDAAKAEIRKVMADPQHPYFNASHPDHNYWLEKMTEYYKMSEV